MKRLSDKKSSIKALLEKSNGKITEIKTASPNTILFISQNFASDKNWIRVCS